MTWWETHFPFGCLWIFMIMSSGKHWFGADMSHPPVFIFYQSNTCMWPEHKVTLQVWKQQITLLTANPTPETTIGTLLTTTFGIYFHISKHYAFTAIYWLINFRQYPLASFYGRKNFMCFHFLFSLPPPSSTGTSLCWVKPTANVYIIIIN